VLSEGGEGEIVSVFRCVRLCFMRIDISSHVYPSVLFIKQFKSRFSNLIAIYVIYVMFCLPTKPTRHLQNA
jgi:hypothetical protein